MPADGSVISDGCDVGAIFALHPITAIKRDGKEHKRRLSSHLKIQCTSK